MNSIAIPTIIGISLGVELISSILCFCTSGNDKIFLAINRIIFVFLIIIFSIVVFGQ